MIKHARIQPQTSLSASGPEFFDVGAAANRGPQVAGYEALQVLILPVLVIDAERRLLFANERGLKLLEKRAPFAVVDEHLHIVEPLPIDQLLTEAMRAGHKMIKFVDDRGVRSTFVVHHMSPSEADNKDRSYLIVGYGGSPTSERLMELYALTRVEAGLVLRLLDGSDISEAAIDLKISRHTARKYLQSIFNKVMVNRQVDLVRKILEDHQWGLGQLD